MERPLENPAIEQLILGQLRRIEDRLRNEIVPLPDIAERHVRADMAAMAVLDILTGALPDPVLEAIERIQRLHQEAWKTPPGLTYRTLHEQQV